LKIGVGWESPPISWTLKILDLGFGTVSNACGENTYHPIRGFGGVSVFDEAINPPGRVGW